MGAKKSVLILTDGSEKVAEIAAGISKALKGNKVTVKEASVFEGTDLLPAEILFIGCCESSPSSFGYVDEMLRHINLAGRRCGIFASSAKAAQYLKKLLKSSEISVDQKILTDANPAGIAGWTAGILAGK